MTGETNLDTLLSTLSAQLDSEKYVFLSIENAAYGDYAALTPIGSFAEKEGLTLLVAKSQADNHGFSYESVFRKITLEIHSSLEAVGLTAAISTRLAQYGISANIIAGYYHDHVFVPERQAQQAFTALQEFARQPN